MVPIMIFLQYYGRGNASTLAQGFQGGIRCVRQETGKINEWHEDVSFTILEVKTTKQQPAYSLPDINIYFLKLGTLVFGGLVALVAYMQT